MKAFNNYLWLNSQQSLNRREFDPENGIHEKQILLNLKMKY